jgi:uncharacterized protein (TIGR02001 family)
MKNRFLSFAAVAAIAALGAGQGASADEPFDIPGEFSANVNLTSDYSFRGISQTDRGPALQGGFDYSADLGEGFGFYAGVWGSNVNFNNGDEGDLELDGYGGFTYGVNGFTFDLGTIYYAYPGAAGALEYDFWEVQGKVGYDFTVLSLTGSLNYSPDYFGGSDDAFYYKLASEVPLPRGFSLSGHLGRQTIEKNATFGTPDYTDWSLGVAYALEGFDLKLEYVDTDLSNSECGGGLDICDARVIASASKAF